MILLVTLPHLFFSCTSLLLFSCVCCCQRETQRTRGEQAEEKSREEVMGEGELTLSSSAGLLLPFLFTPSFVTHHAFHTHQLLCITSPPPLLYCFTCSFLSTLPSLTSLTSLTSLSHLLSPLSLSHLSYLLHAGQEKCSYEGYLSKGGKNLLVQYPKRYFRILGGALFWYKSKEDTSPLGEMLVNDGMLNNNTYI